jgi:RecA/RadA recombinase
MLRLTTESIIDERVYRARNKIDMTLAGALGELLELSNKSQSDFDSPDAYASAFEALADRFPIRFHRDMAAATAEDHKNAIGILRREGDKASWAIRTGAEIGYADPARLSTGSCVVDWVLNKGIPRGYITQFKGAESLGKTFMALQCCAETIRTGGAVVWIAAERFNKDWARSCGVPIPYGSQELDGATEDAAALMGEYNRTLVGGDRFSIIVGKNGNEVLQSIVTAVELNVFDLVVLDSIAVLRRALVLEKKGVGDETMGGEAKLFNDFCTRLESAFNFVESQAGKVLGTAWRCTLCGGEYEKKSAAGPCSKKSRGKCSLVREDSLGAQLRSAVLVINQIRDRGIGSYIPQRPDAPGGRGLRHAKGLELEFDAGEDLITEYGGRQLAYAKRSVFTCTKSKVGPPRRQGAVELHYETVPGLSKAGSIGYWPDLFGCKFKNKREVQSLAEMAGVYTQRGGYIYIGEQKFHGQQAFRTYLEAPENNHVLQTIRAAVLDWIQKGGIE